MRKLAVFATSYIFFLSMSFNILAVTIKDFKTNYLTQYRQKKNYQTKLDLVKAYESLATAQDRQLADLELKADGINLANLRKEIEAAQKKQKPSELIFNQLISKYKVQADSISRDIAIIKSDLTKLVTPVTKTRVDIAEDKALKARVGLRIHKAQDLVKQKFQDLDTVKNDISRYYESIKNQISGEFARKAFSDI